MRRLLMSGWQDSNLRPPAPKAGAIPGYATSRTLVSPLPFFEGIAKKRFLIHKNHFNYLLILCGGRGIRTLGTVASTTV